MACSAYPIVVFCPNFHSSELGNLYGEVISNDLLQTKNYFIHDVCGNLNTSPDDTIIGLLHSASTNPVKKLKKKRNWLRVVHKHKNLIPIVAELVSDYIDVKQGDFQVIIYSKLWFMQSELLWTLNEDFGTKQNEAVADDHFKCLANSLKYKQCSKESLKTPQPLVKFILMNIIKVIRFLDSIMCMLLLILKFSTLAAHMSNSMNNAIENLEFIQQRNSLTNLRSGNYILGLIVDWFGGLFLIYWFISLVSIEEVLDILAEHSEIVVTGLKNTVYYLMGSPVDLKLNGPLNNVLGKFFLFHIELWWAFLGYSRPLLELGFRMFICLGCLGLSFQLAILADILAVATFHVYIIYVYAARLYHAQVTGLASLSRVFLGRKRNPLPGRVDSCPYTTEQLLIGTIAFTVLLFLLPTTLVYYIVFTVMRLVLVTVGGVLTRIRRALSALPLYSTLLYLVNSPTTAGCVRLTPQMVGTDQFVLQATLVQTPWWQMVKACMPASPPPVNWGLLCWHLVTGTLIYPV